MAKKNKTPHAVDLSTARTYFVLDTTQGRHCVEYTIEVMGLKETDGKVVTMYCADNAQWSDDVDGTLVAQVMDSGDGYTWTVNPMSADYMDASVAQQMMILLMFLDDHDKMRSCYEIVSTQTVVSYKD